MVEKVREQLAPPPSTCTIPAISSASSGSSEGMSIRIFEHCVPGKRLQCIGYVHLQGADVRGGRDTNIFFAKKKKMRMYGQKIDTGSFCLSGMISCCIYIIHPSWQWASERIGTACKTHDSLNESRAGWQCSKKCHCLVMQGLTG